jgi:hypothetical protein
MNVFNLIRISDGAVVATWPKVPATVEMMSLDPPLRVHNASAGWANDDYRIDSEIVADPVVVPPRRLVSKSVILSRITDAQLDAALGLMTTRQKERWRAPDKPSIYFDDAETLALLQAIGADPAVVMAE